MLAVSPLPLVGTWPGPGLTLSHRAPVHVVAQQDIDSDEVECIVANLIAKKYIKGYISHSQQKLVRCCTRSGEAHAHTWLTQHPHSLNLHLA